MAGVQLGRTAHLGAPMAQGERVTKLTPPSGHLRRFFQMFLFITFVPVECTGRRRRVVVFRVLRAECTAVCAAAPPAFTLYLHIHTHRHRETIERTLTITTSLCRVTTDGLRIPCAVSVL